MAESITPSNIFRDRGPAAAVGKAGDDWKYKFFSYLLLTMIAFTMIVPFLWMISTSFKPESEILRRNVFPNEPTLDNYSDVINKTGPPPLVQELLHRRRDEHRERGFL